MALAARDIAVIVGLIRRCRQRARVLSLGHPDILATPQEVAFLFDGKLLAIDNERVREERLGTSDADCIGAASILFDALGADLVCIDRRPGLPGVHEHADLNEPIPDYHAGRYDLVIDPGTIEHVMNIGQAFASIVKAMRVGGHVYHINPLIMPNHGYWSLSPAAYHDFYAANGCELISATAWRKGDAVAVPTTDRFRMENNGKVVMTAVARKVRHVASTVWPMQAKYR